MLTVDNRSTQDWTNVEIWLNTHYRMHVRDRFRPAAGCRRRSTSFVAGFGQRFDYRTHADHAICG